MKMKIKGKIKVGYCGTGADGDQKWIIFKDGKDVTGKKNELNTLEHREVVKQIQMLLFGMRNNI